MAEEKERSNRYWLAIAIVLVAFFLIALYVLPSRQGGKQKPPAEETEITFAQFEATLRGAPAIALVQDLRTAPDNESKHAVQACGVNLARSLGGAGKNITNYAYDAGDVCYTPAGEAKGIQECESEFKGTYALVISYGTASTQFYRERTLIATNKYYGANCFISFEEQAEDGADKLPEVDPNATAKTANMTADLLFNNCTLREFCLNVTGEEAHTSCLLGMAMQSQGDPRCCFGIQNSTHFDDCIRGTAAIIHGTKEDYCQFTVSQAARDECYFKYGVGLAYPPYCDMIVGDEKLKSDCHAQALTVASQILGSQ